MNILVLSQYYDPEPIPKPGELAAALMERGHTLSVITGFPNYPSGTLYPGYRLRLVQKATSGPIPIVRAFEFPYHGRSVVGRMVNFWSFALAAPLASLFVSKPDVIYVWHPPLTIGIAAWLIAKLRGARFVYDVQDLWPEIAVLSGLIRPGTLLRVMLWLEKFVYRKADHILCVTEGARENIIGKGVAPEKVSVMQHWIDEDMLRKEPPETRAEVRRQYGWRDDFVAVFAGNLGLVQGLDTVIAAASRLREEDKIRIVFIGDGVDRQRLASMVDEQGLRRRVLFIDRRPMAEMPRFFAAADALLIHLRRSKLSHLVIPTKTLAYMAAGKPIVLAMEGAAVDLVKAAGAGVTVPPDDPEALADALRTMAATPLDELERLGVAGRDYLRRTMTKSEVIPKYEALLRSVAGL